MRSEDTHGLAKLLLDSLEEGVYLLDPERRITLWSKGAEALTGYSEAEVLGRRCADDLLVHLDPMCGGGLACQSCPATRAMREGITIERRLFLRHKHGHRLPVRIRTTPLRDADGGILGAMEIFADDSTAQATAAELERLRNAAMLDALTGIGNRRYAETELARRLAELARYGWPLAVLFLDVDRFKEINDTHGHAIGDEAIKMVARTLGAAVRASDALCRWGGDEFVVLLRDVPADQLAAVADKLRALIAASALPLERGRIAVTVSVGATLALPDDTLHTAVSRADELMFASKRAGGNRCTADAAPMSAVVEPWAKSP